jgi:hypothetical protein
MTTLVVIRHAQVGERHFLHGEECPPGLIPREVIDHWLDQSWLKEYDSTERRSLYRLLHRFSGCAEREPLSQDELTSYSIGD